MSADDVASHKAWITEIEKVKKCKIGFPIIGDEKRAVSAAYGMLDQTHLVADMPMTLRSVFFIGPDKKIKLILTYPASTGRNFDEVVRCLDSLQLAVSHKVATPADWKIGSQCCLLPTLTDEEAKAYPDMKVLSASCKLRMVPCPLGAAAKKDKKKPAEQQTKMTKEEKDAKKAAEKAAKDAIKKEKACIKEGGKKGQDIEGMAAMGTKWANVNLIEPQGSMEHLRMAFKAMIKEVDPEGDDRKGGAFPFGKMIFSAGDASLSAIIHVPAAEAEVIDIADWCDFVFKATGDKAKPTSDPTIWEFFQKADADNNKFPLKDRDVVIGQSFLYLKNKNLVLDDDSDDEDYSGAANLGAVSADY